MSSRVKVTRDDVQKVVKSIAALTGKQILVGIPEEKTERGEGVEQEPINNATLGYIHEHGSPAKNIPARPFLVPGVEDATEDVEPRLRRAATFAMKGNQERATAEMEAAGMLAQSAVRNKITDGDFAPLSEATLRARARKGRKGAIAELESRAAGNDPNPENARPLIDSGQMRNAITYVVRKK